MVINKEYKGHLIRIMKIPNQVDTLCLHGFMEVPNPFNDKLHVFLQMSNGMEINLGFVYKEICEDEPMLNLFIEERIKYWCKYLTNLVENQ